MSKQEIIKTIKDHCVIAINENEISKEVPGDYWAGQIRAYRNIVGYLNILGIGENE